MNEFYFETKDQDVQYWVSKHGKFVMITTVNEGEEINTKLAKITKKDLTIEKVKKIVKSFIKENHPEFSKKIIYIDQD